MVAPYNGCGEASPARRVEFFTEDPLADPPSEVHRKASPRRMATGRSTRERGGFQVKGSEMHWNAEAARFVMPVGAKVSTQLVIDLLG